MRSREVLRNLLEYLLIFAVFALHASWPMPDVNEAHYLAKARHFWEPAWCAGDVFVDSSDAHLVFYSTVGALAKFCSFPTAVVIGRILGWALLAGGWLFLSRSLFPRFGWAVVSAGLFAALNERTQMAGEWVIGGVEAKEITYACLFVALGMMIRGRWSRVWPWLGLGSMFHVVVGGWSAICAGVAWLCAGRKQASLRSMLPGLALGALLALPGLIPALMLSRGVDPAIAAEANRIQVFERLPHHLNPAAFKEGAIILHAATWCLFGVLCFLTRREQNTAGLRIFVATTGVITLLGYGIAFALSGDPLATAGLLRFYWFRMSDAILPLGVALLALQVLMQLEIKFPKLLLAGLLIFAGLGAWHLADIQLQIAKLTKPRSEKNADDLAAWREVCAWAKANTQPTDLFLTPAYLNTFKFFSDRPEVASSKDMPQDAQSIVEWWQKMYDIHLADLGPDGKPIEPTYIPTSRWRKSLGTMGPERLGKLAEKYHAKYAVVAKLPDLPPLPFPIVHENDSYWVLAFPK